jgi:hypothetical protein
MIWLPWGCRGPIPCLLGEGRSILPSLSGVVWNPSVESLVMAHGGDGSPPWVEPMTVASQPSPMGEKFKPLKRSVMNSLLLKRMVSPREKTTLNRCSLPVATASAGDGTIRMSRGKAHYKSPFLARQLLVLFAPRRNRVVRIERSNSEMVLRTIEHTIIYPGSNSSLEIITLRPAV